MMLHLHK